jgi:prevent-host-death family protein
MMTASEGRRRSTRRVSTAEAKATLSALIGMVAFGRERVVIERRGRPLAVLVGVDEAEQLPHLPSAAPRRRGALALAGGWSDIDDEVMDRLIGEIYAARDSDRGRAVDLST